MKTLKKIIFASIVVLLTISCKKDDLPKATQEGKNIMAAKVNGKTWVKSACSSCIGGGGGLNVIYEKGFLNLRGQRKNNSDNSVVGIAVNNLRLGENITDGLNSIMEYNDYGNSKYYKTSANSVGIINVTKIDVGRRIISGTFSFKAENEDNPIDIITITDGRFDVTYN